MIFAPIKVSQLFYKKMEDYLTELTFMRFEMYELILQYNFHASE